MTRHRDCLVTDTFHQTAVTNDCICMVINKIIAKAGIHHPLGQCHTNSICNPLPQWTGSRFNTLGMTILRMACGHGAHLAEITKLVHGHVFVTSQMQQRINKH